ARGAATNGPVFYGYRGSSTRTFGGHQRFAVAGEIQPGSAGVGPLRSPGSPSIHGDRRDAARVFLSATTGKTGSSADLGAVELDGRRVVGAPRGFLGLSHGRAFKGWRDRVASCERR